MAVSVSVTCLFKIRHWIFIVSNTHSVCVITEQSSLRHQLSQRATFTLLKRTGLCIKFSLNPCTDHKPCEQTPALFSRALQSQAKLRVQQSPTCPVSKHVFPSTLTSPGICRLPKRCTRRRNPYQTRLRQWAVAPTSTGAPVLPVYWTGVSCSRQEQGWALVNFRSPARL